MERDLGVVYGGKEIIYRRGGRRWYISPHIAAWCHCCVPVVVVGSEVARPLLNSDLDKDMDASHESLITFTIGVGQKT